jgi:adenylyltransferase/sulfurtransferase
MIDRYSRQTIFSEIGEAGQKKLGNSYAVLIGCGALGSVIATTLVRAGIGRLRIVDRDLIEYHNLQRQILYDEDDIKSRLPKAIAAERHLRKANSSVEIESIVADVHYANIEKLVSGADVILDGLDNLEARLLVNDVSLKHKIPWVYGAAVSSSGMTMTIVPGETPCFRCILPSLPPSGVVPNCDTAGVIAPAPFIIGSLQSTEAIKLLIGAKGLNHELLLIDVWRDTFRRLKVGRHPDCPACHGRYEFLETKHGVRTAVLCGQNSVQVSDPGVEGISLDELASHLESAGTVDYNQTTLDFRVNGHEIIVFPDGRAILKNSLDESLARELYSKYISKTETIKSGG